MKFRTTLPLSPSMDTIDYTDAILGVGSCFIEHIGGLLVKYKFRTLLNPFGILYNPISIAQCLQRVLNNQPYAQEELIKNQGIWYSFDHHGHFSDLEAEKTVAKMNTALQESADCLQQANWLMVTLGTAMVYRHIQQDRIVANCHKFPNHHFQKERLTIAQIIEAFGTLFSALTNRNEAIKIVLTVSPVRHIRDGIIENQRSKAVLLLAVEELVQTFSNVYYFPAYELIMDDLRDYRFFEQDLVHPNRQATEYIWDFFQKTYFSDETQALLKQVQKIIRASEHRTFHPNTPQHIRFQQQQLAAIADLEKNYPFLNFEKEKSYFSSSN